MNEEMYQFILHCIPICIGVLCFIVNDVVVWCSVRKARTRQEYVEQERKTFFLSVVLLILGLTFLVYYLLLPTLGGESLVLYSAVFVISKSGLLTPLALVRRFAQLVIFWSIRKAKSRLRGRIDVREHIRTVVQLIREHSPEIVVRSEISDFLDRADNKKFDCFVQTYGSALVDSVKNASSEDTDEIFVSPQDFIIKVEQAISQVTQVHTDK